MRMWILHVWSNTQFATLHVTPAVTGASGGVSAARSLNSVRCRVAGTVVGWVSSAFYIGSRVSQIVKNAQRRSAEGLALSMFVAAICANCFYGAGAPPGSI